MRIAYLECFSGISGDMFLGALVGAGVPARLLEETVEALKIGARLEISQVQRSGISSTKVDVWVDGEKDVPGKSVPTEAVGSEEDLVHRTVPGHKHDHVHPHAHGSADATHGQHSPAPGHEHHAHGRGLIEIRQIIASASISERAKSDATAMFDALAQAEGKIHGLYPEQVHFHEVGAVDAIVDIVCAAVGAEALGVDKIVCSPLNVGGGTVKCAHGDFPVPAPATVELLKNLPVYSSGIQVELVTPTGAAIVRTLAHRFGPFPAIQIERSGYGAGSRDLPGHPNVVRLTVGEAAQNVKAGSDVVTVLEANLDDLNPQVFGYAMDRLFEEGALDAFAIPVQMKKNRPGMLLTVLSKPEDADKLTRLIFLETTTLGVRRRDEKRQILARRWQSVVTPWGEVRIKIGSMNGTISNYAPEYEDCRKLATEHRIPLKTVMQEAARVYLGAEKTA